MSFLKTLFAAGSFFAITIAPAVAETLPAPQGKVLLTISGSLNNETAGGVVALDLDILKSMETKTFTTSTIWLENEVEFTAVSLHDILEHAGATGSMINTIALNDYQVEFPRDEIGPDAPFVAFLMDGKEMSARGKGPLWIVYPYDEGAQYRTEVTYSRSIWQLDRIVSLQ